MDQPGSAVWTRLSLVVVALAVGWRLPDPDASSASTSTAQPTTLTLPAGLRWVVWPREREAEVLIEGRLATLRPAPGAGQEALGVCAWLGAPEGRVFVPATWSVSTVGGGARLFFKLVRDGKSEIVPVAAVRKALPVTRVTPEVDSSEAQLHLCVQVSGPDTTATLEVGDG